MKKDEVLLFKDNKIKEDRIVGIAKVYDYDKIINAEGNRNLTPGIKTLRESINEHGNVSSITAVMHDGLFYIVDGWHRRYILKEKGLPISITLVEATLEEINRILIILNSSQKSWIPENYLNSWVEVTGNPNYIALQEIWEHYGVSLNTLVKIYNYDVGQSQNDAAFRAGEWAMGTKSLGDKVLIYATELEEKTKFDFALNARFIMGFTECVSKKGYDQERMIRQCKKYSNHIHHLDKPKDHALQVQKIFNLGKVEEELVTLAVENRTATSK